jgi:hypothetical protein
VSTNTGMPQRMDRSSPPVAAAFTKAEAARRLNDGRQAPAARPWRALSTSPLRHPLASKRRSAAVFV